MDVLMQDSCESLNVYYLRCNFTSYPKNLILNRINNAFTKNYFSIHHIWPMEAWVSMVRVLYNIDDKIYT